MGWAFGGSVPVGVRFYALLQVALGTILLCSGYQVSFRVVKQLGCDVNHPPLSSAEVTYCLYFPSRPSWALLG